MINVANISGGRTSMYMGIRLYNSGFDGIFCYQNTGMETPQTIEFLRKSPFPLVVIQYKNTEPFFTIETLDTIARQGEPFRHLVRKRGRIPNVRERFCTAEMKVLTLRRYMRSIGVKKWNSYLGIRADEAWRAVKIKKRYEKHNGKIVKVNPVFPLIRAGVTAQIVGDFWKERNWDLDLPMLPNGKTVCGNCVGCFQKSEAELALTLKQYPELYAVMEEMENEIGGNFRDEYSMSEFRQHVENDQRFDFNMENENYCFSENGGCGD